MSEASVDARLLQLEEAIVAPITILESTPAVTAEAQAAVVQPAICASLKREENLHYRFMILYQVLVAVLAIATLFLLLFAAWRVAEGGSDKVIAAILSGAGSVVTGIAAGFLERQRRDARVTYHAAQKGLNKYGCTA